MTGARTLRPLSVADLVDEIFRLYRRHFGLLFGISALAWLPASILIAIGLATVGRFSGGEVDATGITVLLVGGLVALCTFPILVAALTHATASSYLARGTTLRDAFRRALRTSVRLVLAFLVLFLVVLVSAVAVVVLGALLAGIAAAARVPILAAILAVVAGVGAVVAAVWIAISWSLLAQAIVLEDAGVFGALRRSARLVAGARRRVIGINLLLFVIGLVLVSIPSAFLTVVLAPLPLPENVGAALGQVVSAFAQVAYYPIELGTLTLLYYDLRVRKEGFDLTLAAERLRAP